MLKSRNDQRLPYRTASLCLLSDCWSNHHVGLGSTALQGSLRLGLLLTWKEQQDSQHSKIQGICVRIFAFLCPLLCQWIVVILSFTFRRFTIQEREQLMLCNDWHKNARWRHPCTSSFAYFWSAILVTDEQLCSWPIWSSWQPAYAFRWSCLHQRTVLRCGIHKSRALKQGRKRESGTGNRGQENGKN